MKGAVPWRAFTWSHRSASAALMVACAPSSWASWSRRVEGSIAITRSLPRSPAWPTGQTDRSGPEDHHAVVGSDLSTVRGVHADRERLGQRRHLEVDRVGHRNNRVPAGRLDQHLASEPPFGRAVAHPAELVVARMYHDAVAYRDVGDVGSDRRDRARQLVAEQASVPGPDRRHRRARCT